MKFLQQNCRLFTWLSCMFGRNPIVVLWFMWIPRASLRPTASSESFCRSVFPLFFCFLLVFLFIFVGFLPGHAGFWGNELVGIFAKLISSLLSLHHYFGVICSYMVQTWRSLWDQQMSNKLWSSETSFWSLSVKFVFQPSWGSSAGMFLHWTL